MFSDTLKIKLTVGGVTIPGANVKYLKAEVHPYGFNCRVNFWVSNETTPDTLFPTFVKKDLMSAKAEILPHLMPPGKTVEAMVLQGPVMGKRILTERTIENIHLSNNPVLYRHYEIEFADPAFVFWRQHLPCELMVDKSVKDVIEAHKGQVTLEYKWDLLTTVHPINTLPLGTHDGKASFYDFIVWFVYTYGGVWTYDTVNDKYVFSAEKDAAGQASAIDSLDAHPPEVVFPETIRNKVNVLNAYSENPQKKPIDNAQAQANVFRDYIARFPIAADLDARTALETRRLIVREDEIRLHFRRFPLITLRPGLFIKIQGYEWSKSLFSYAKEYRVKDIFIEASAANPEVTADQNMEFTIYNIDMTSQLELKAEKYVSLPSFEYPVFPMLVEGKVLSEQGEVAAETYQIYPDQKTSTDYYKVEIPLFANQRVIVPFEPIFFSGHFYYPLYKRERVLIALHFHSARIIGMLDWRPGARLPMEQQGNHILMGKTAQSKTSISHIYINEKPELNLKRTSANDTQIFRVTEGGMILEVKEVPAAATTTTTPAK